jgi:hypothetical protein
MTATEREHYAQKRGVAKVKCPIKRCDYTHRFQETDYTIEDTLTAERRAEFLRAHHNAGHPQDPRATANPQAAIFFNIISQELLEYNIPVAIRQRIVARMIATLDRVDEE